MAFRFKLSEPFDNGFKRIATEQIDRALAQLNDNEDRVVAVHECRKALKRIRALLRLVRPALGDSTFRSENAQMRDIAGGLSGARDRHVLLETLAKLEAASEAAGTPFAAAIRTAIMEIANGGDAPKGDVAAMKHAASLLTDAKKRIAGLRLTGDGFAAVGPGLQASYRKARRAFREAYRDPHDDAFHEWRKGTQQHWRHMALLARAWPECLGARSTEARALSQLLGDDHDLALLIAFLNSDAADAIADAHVLTAKQAALRRQDELRTIARPLGQRLFAEGPKTLHRRIAVYWAAAVEAAKNGIDEATRQPAKPPKPVRPAKKVTRVATKRRRAAARA
jgi:CHAD domain-containing protein